MKETRLYIKNMVCDRCKMAVERVLRDHGLHPVSVELGTVVVAEELSREQKGRVKSDLEMLGFELLDDRKHQTIELIKAAIIRMVRYQDHQPPLNLSDYLQQELRQDYSALSKLFSEYTSMTIERYFIEQRIERVKELITYGEMTLTQIAWQLHYSSVAYLSSQFKQVAGMKPSEFKALQQYSRRSIDQI